MPAPRASPFIRDARSHQCLGEALLAKFMGKKKVIAETGAGQHGVALATACALVGIPCEIYMGQVDIEKEAPNVTKMKILGCKLIAVTRGQATLKDAVDDAFDEYLKNPDEFIYAIGSVVSRGSSGRLLLGPAPVASPRTVPSPLISELVLTLGRPPPLPSHGARLPVDHRQGGPPAVPG